MRTSSFSAAGREKNLRASENSWDTRAGVRPVERVSMYRKPCWEAAEMRAWAVEREGSEMLIMDRLAVGRESAGPSEPILAPVCSPRRGVFEWSKSTCPQSGGDPWSGGGP